MKTFHDAFRDRIDGYFGTVQINAADYKAIQADALKKAAEIAELHGCPEYEFECDNDIQAVTAGGIQRSILEEVKQLEAG